MCLLLLLLTSTHLATDAGSPPAGQAVAAVGRREPQGSWVHRIKDSISGEQELQGFSNSGSGCKQCFL